MPAVMPSAHHANGKKLDVKFLAECDEIFACRFDGAGFVYRPETLGTGAGCRELL